jgi:hypothetical protein
MLAYLDPGSGSIIASALVGGVAAAGVAAKQARMRFSGLGRKKRAAEAQPETEVTEATPAGGNGDGEATATPQDEATPVASDS